MTSFKPIRHTGSPDICLPLPLLLAFFLDEWSTSELTLPSYATIVRV